MSEFNGEHPPGEQVDGYLPGIIDGLRAAFLAGHLTESEYDEVRGLITSHERVKASLAMVASLRQDDVRQVLQQKHDIQSKYDSLVSRIKTKAAEWESDFHNYQSDCIHHFDLNVLLIDDSQKEIPHE